MSVVNHSWRWVATFFGILLAGAEVALNAVHAAGGGDLTQLGVIVTAAVTAAGAAALPIAERAWSNGDRWKAGGLMVVFFPLVLIVSFTSGLERTSSRQDGALATGKASAKRNEISQTAFDAALAAKNRECEGRKDGSTACKRAEKAFLAVSNMAVTNITGMAQGLEDGATRRIAQALASFGVSEDGVRMWLPFVMPTALLFGGFLFIAIGISPIHEKPTVKVDPIVDEPRTITIPPRTEEEVKRWFVNRIITSGRSLSGTPLRELAEECGIPHSTLAVWVRRWGDDGTIEITREGRRTTYRLPRIRKAVVTGV